MKSIILILVSTFFLNIHPQQKWQKLNGPEGGKILGLAAKGDTIFAASSLLNYSGVLFYSVNGGINWEKIKKTSGTFLDFSFSRDNGIIASSYADGLYKSFDLKNWIKVYNDKEFLSIGIDSMGYLYAGTNFGEIYISKNDGTNWNLFFNDYNDAILRFITIPSGKMFCGAINKIFKKDFSDSNWISINLDVMGYIRPFTDDSNNIFFFSLPWLFSSPDSGISWNKSGIIPFFQGNYMLDCLYNKRMIAAMGDESGSFGTGWGIAVSDDKGLSWRWSNSGLPPKFSGCGRLARSGDNTYVGTNAAGVFKSTDYGESWFSINNGITAANTMDITFDSEGNLYSASWSNGIHKSTDKGLSWRTINSGLTNVYLYSIIADDNNNLIAATDQGTFRSTDSGENWNKVNSWFFAFLNKDRINRLYGLRYGSGLYKSTDSGINWTRIDNGFLTGYIYGFTLDKSDNIYAGTFGGAIYKSTNDGSTWLKVYQSSVDNSFIMSITEAPNGYLYAMNRYEGILRSTDNGESWSVRKTDTGYQLRLPIAVNQKGTVFASCSNSKFYSSTDNGDSWKDVTDNLIYTSVQDIAFDKEGKMYLATDESVWTEAPDSTVNITESISIPNKYSLEQNYPNPFNPTTTIKYSVLKENNVIVKVYNSLGQEIETLVNETKPPGSYEAKFDGSNFTSGIYFYRMQSGTFTQTKKMILLR